MSKNRIETVPQDKGGVKKLITDYLDLGDISRLRRSNLLMQGMFKNEFEPREFEAKVELLLDEYGFNHKKIDRMIQSLKSSIDDTIPAHFTRDNEINLADQARNQMQVECERLYEESGKINDELYELKESITAVSEYEGEHPGNFIIERNEIVDRMKTKHNKLLMDYFSLGEKSEYIRELLEIPENNEVSMSQFKI